MILLLHALFSLSQKFEQLKSLHISPKVAQIDVYFRAQSNCCFQQKCPAYSKLLAAPMKTLTVHKQVEKHCSIQLGIDTTTRCFVAV